MNGHLGMTSDFVFCSQKTNGNLNAPLDFLICCQKANDPFETTLKTSKFDLVWF